MMDPELLNQAVANAQAFVRNAIEPGTERFGNDLLADALYQEAIARGLKIVPSPQPGSVAIAVAAMRRARAIVAVVANCESKLDSDRQAMVTIHNLKEIKANVAELDAAIELLGEVGT